MKPQKIHQCQCEICQREEGHAKQKEHRLMNVFLSRLNEQERRWYAALEGKKLGRGGLEIMAQVTGMHVNTIRHGRKELNTELSERPLDRIRVAGGGRKAVEKKHQK